MTGKRQTDLVHCQLRCNKHSARAKTAASTEISMKAVRKGKESDQRSHDKKKRNQQAWCKRDLSLSSCLFSTRDHGRVTVPGHLACDSENRHTMPCAHAKCFSLEPHPCEYLSALLSLTGRAACYAPPLQSCRFPGPAPLSSSLCTSHFGSLRR